MTAPLRLHYAPDNASLCVRLALEALGLPYETVLVDRAVRAQKSPAYLALNPNGLIPVLETPDGPLFETGAILLWLSDRYATLMPSPDAKGRAHAVQWLFWLSNTLHPTLRMMFYPDQYSDGSAEDLRKLARKRACGQLDLLSAAHNADWLEADGPTAQGCYLAPMLRWCALYGGATDWFDLIDWPRLLDFARRADSWSATQRAVLAEGLGPTPFSAPQACNPPEGQPL